MSNISIGSYVNSTSPVFTPTSNNIYITTPNYWSYFRKVRKRYCLEVDKEYLLSYGVNKIRKVKFVQSTPKGFNFVDIETERLIFKRHIYRCKQQEHDGYTAQINKNDFWVWMVGSINVALPFDEQTDNDV